MKKQIFQRRKRANWLKYHQASLVAREAGCTSRKTYEQWWNATRPNNIPKKPDRVYNEWTTWGEFLDTNNAWGVDCRGTWRPYWEAVRWSQRVCIDNDIVTSTQWMRFYDNNEESMPVDIPRNAHYHYKEDWMGWPTWLGLTLEDRVKSAKQEIGLFALVTQSWTASNVIRVVVASDGKEQLKDKLRDGGYTALSVYHLQRDLIERMQELMNAYGTVQPDGTFIVADVYGLLFEFDQLCEKVK